MGRAVKEEAMAIDTRPRRRLPGPEAEEEHLDQLITDVERHATRGMAPRPAPPAPPAGPSWREFLGIQIGLLLAVALLFGAVASAFIARAGGAGGGSTAA